MLKRYRRWVAAALTMMCLGLPGASLAEEEALKVFFALGKGRVVRESIPKAKKVAVKEGLNSAVEKALYDLLSEPAISVNFEAVTEILSESPELYIDGYRVVAERRFGGYYHVGVEASVSMDRITEKLSSSGIVLQGSEKPKLLFLVSERLPGFEDFDHWWGPGMSYIATFSDDVMGEQLSQRGFQVLSHRAVMEEGVRTGKTGLINTEDALRIGAAFGADVVVTGRAWTEASGNVMGEERSFRGAVEVESFLVSTGKAIGRTHKVEVAVGTDASVVGSQALIEAAQQVGVDLSVLIVSAMKEKKRRTTMIEVVVEGTNFFENFTRLSREMEALDGVISLRPRERRMERAVMVVNFTGEGKKLAESLLARNFKGFSVTLSEVSRDHIKVDMVAGGKNTFMR